jgi:hypothetical protein
MACETCHSCSRRRNTLSPRLHCGTRDKERRGRRKGCRMLGWAVGTLDDNLMVQESKVRELDFASGTSRFTGRPGRHVENGAAFKDTHVQVHGLLCTSGKHEKGPNRWWISGSHVAVKVFYAFLVGMWVVHSQQPGNALLV